MGAKKLKTILAVVTDPFSTEQPAALKAMAIARRCGARLVLLNTFMIPQPVSDVPMGSSEDVLASAMRQRRDQLQKLARSARLQQPVRCLVRWDYPAHEAIVREALATKADLLVSESHRHGRLARLLLANTDWELMRSCPCPMWFVRSKDLPQRPRLLVAVDPRHTHAKPARLDDRLLAAATGITAQLNGRVDVVHSYETPASEYPTTLLEPVRLPISPQRTRDFVAKTIAEVTKLAEKHGIERASCHIEQGNASTVIAAQAFRRKADVIVLGAVSRSLLSRPVIGNTAERVIDQVSCDVFVVKPAGFKTPVKRRSRLGVNIDEVTVRPGRDQRAMRVRTLPVRNAAGDAR